MDAELDQLFQQSKPAPIKGIDQSRFLSELKTDSKNSVKDEEEVKLDIEDIEMDDVGSIESMDDKISNKMTRKQKKELKSDKPEKQERTLFLGNLPIECCHDKTLSAKLKNLFSKYGHVESIRFRSIAFAEASSRRTCFIKKNFREKSTTCNGYVVMKDAASAKAALSENATLFTGRHLRVDLAAGDVSTKVNTKKSIFIGNLPLEIDEEPVWQLFGACGEVTNVRLIRDRVSNLGKGFGYVTFAKKEAVDVAVKLAGTACQGRPIRISKCCKPGMVQKKKERATAYAQKIASVKEKLNVPDKMARARSDKTNSQSAKTILGGARRPVTEIIDNTKPDPSVKVSAKEKKLQEELKTKFGKLFHKKFPFNAAIDKISKTVESSSKKEKSSDSTHGLKKDKKKSTLPHISRK